MKTISSSAFNEFIKRHLAESVRLDIKDSFLIGCFYWASRIYVFRICFTTLRQFMFMMNCEPSPILLFTSTEPPIYSIIFLQIDSPKPVPYEFLLEFSFSFEKSMNKCFNPCSDMPTPVSMTLSLSFKYLCWPSLISFVDSELCLILTFFLT